MTARQEGPDPVLVEVAVPRSGAGVLTYVAPALLAPLARPGVRVRVPLKRRAVTGLVVGLVGTTPLAPEALRDVDEVLDAEPVLPAHLIELARFVSGYYRSHLGDVVAAMLPATLLRGDAEEIEITTAGAGFDPGRLTPLQAAVLVAVRGHGRMRLAAALAAAGAASRAPVAALVEAGFLRHARRRRDRAPQLEVAAVRLPSSRVLDELIAAAGRATRQREVLQWLAEQGRPALVTEVCAAVGCSPAVVQALAAKGLVERFSQLPASRPRWTLGGNDEVRHRLSTEQQAAVDAIAAALERHEFAPILLQGITGSGKTEVYLRGLEAVLAAGGTGLVLVPEIGLTPAAVGAVERRFGDRVAVLHSAQAEGERWREWRRIHDGEARVVVGPRSALFAPLDDLRLIVVDEEHDAAYKQQEAPRYHARDLALVLGRRLDIPVLLCSATPSTEAAGLVARGLASRLRLTVRVAGGTLPEVELVDLRTEPPDPGEQGRTLLSRRLRALLEETIDRGEQAILLMQRRGWAPVLLCRDCGHRAECPACSVAMVVHRRSSDLRCHYCGTHQGIPATCPTCGGSLLDAVGAGTEKVAERLASVLPGVTTAILDRDTVRRRSGLEDTLGAFASGRVQVLVDTQMVAKGHHFPNVTLTGVISADALLALPDFRAAERTFQLLTQVGGRAGRGDRPGRVVIQTYYPDHPAVLHASRHDVDAFLEEELRFRTAFSYPPAARMALVRFEAATAHAARRAAETAAAAAHPIEHGVRLRGPCAAPLERLRGQWRWQVLVSARNRDLLRFTVERLESPSLPAGVKRIVDVDPLSTL